MSATPDSSTTCPMRSFDVVLYRLVLHHLVFQGPLAPVFSEAARLLRPGGALVAIEPGLWHPVGLGLALANEAGVARAVHGTPDDIPLSPRRLIAEARRGRPDRRAPRGHLHAGGGCRLAAAVAAAARRARVQAARGDVRPYADADRAGTLTRSLAELHTSYMHEPVLRADAGHRRVSAP